MVFNPKQSLAAGFDIDFLRPGKLTSAMERGKKTAGKVYFDGAGEGAIADWETYVTEQLGAATHGGFTSLPTGSHDNPRMANEERKTPAELEVLLTFFLTQPGIPLIYYGDEIGMRYVAGSPDVEGSLARSGSRTPMQWDGGEDAGFSTAPKTKLYIPLDPDPNRPTVAGEDKDPTSQLTYVRDLLKLRKSYAALSSEGTLEFLGDKEHPYPMIYLRHSGNERYVVALNPSNRSVETAIPTQGAKWATYLFGTTATASYKRGKSADALQMPAMSAAIFRLEAFVAYELPSNATQSVFWSCSEPRPRHHASCPTTDLSNTAMSGLCESKRVLTGGERNEFGPRSTREVQKRYSAEARSRVASLPRNALRALPSVFRSYRSFSALWSARSPSR